jgi:hypothetical protein
MRKMNYNLAPANPGEGDDNLSLMNRWERAQGMKLKDLTDEEWIDVVSAILVMTKAEAREYLAALRARNA